MRTPVLVAWVCILIGQMIPTLETERLWLRPLELVDAVRVQELFPQWEVVRFLASAVPWPFPADGVLRHYRDEKLPAMERGEEWHWTLRLKSDPGVVIGSIGLFGVGENHRGFWLGTAWHGLGLMSEASEAVNDFWFGVLGRPVMRVPKAVGNEASRRISEKNGMRVVGTEEREYVGGRMLSEIWELTIEEWRLRRGLAVAGEVRSE